LQAVEGLLTILVGAAVLEDIEQMYPELLRVAAQVLKQLFMFFQEPLIQ
jgi:hypothetical protein